MATNAENIGQSQAARETILEAAGMIIDATANIQEAQEALAAVHEDHEDSTLLNEALGSLASAKSHAQDFHTSIQASQESLFQFTSGLEGLQQ